MFCNSTKNTDCLRIKIAMKTRNYEYFSGHQKPVASWRYRTYGTATKTLLCFYVLSTNQIVPEIQRTENSQDMKINNHAHFFPLKQLHPCQNRTDNGQFEKQYRFNSMPVILAGSQQWGQPYKCECPFLTDRRTDVRELLIKLHH